MTLLAITPDGWAGSQLLGAAGLAAIGFYQLLPRPGAKSVALGTFLCLAAAAVAGLFLVTAFGQPGPDFVGRILFWLFAAGAVGFGGVLVTQANPARGAIAFAFVILSSCGLFLLLAAPFLMAATVIIYAGAVIVTFLFLLMLSHAGGPSDENDRTREPLLGSLAGFAFAGLILFTLHVGGGSDAVLPTPPLTAADRAGLDDARRELDAALAADKLEPFEDAAKRGHDKLAAVLGESFAAADTKGSVLDRHRSVVREVRGSGKKFAAADARVAGFLDRTAKLQQLNRDTEDRTLFGGGDLTTRKAALQPLRDEVVVYSGHGLLPARNVANIGYVLYSEHLLAVEMAGTLLLVATIGAVAIAGRSGRGGDAKGGTA